MTTLANSEDPYEMLHNKVFHQHMHCLLRHNPSSEIEIQYVCLELINCDPLIYTMDHSDFTVCSFMENSISPKRVKE